MRLVDPKLQVEVASTNHSSSEKTTLNDLSYGIKNLDRSFFSVLLVTALHQGAPGNSVNRNKNVPISDRFICFVLTVKRRWRPVL